MLEISEKLLEEHFKIEQGTHFSKRFFKSKMFFYWHYCVDETQDHNSNEIFDLKIFYEKLFSFDFKMILEQIFFYFLNIFMRIE